MPHPVDVAVGARVREIRIRAGLTQQELADALGLSFQQVQKYEKGANRMGASRLVEVARTLGCSLDDLFEGVDPKSEGGAGASALDKDAAKVARDWARISDQGVRRVMREVIRGMAAA